MSIERLVGLNVIDDEAYTAYREAMTPILATYGGAFGYDFRIAEVLKSRSQAPINRLFTLSFPTEEAMKAFFADTDYLAVRRRFFEPAVKDVTLIATYPQPT